MESTRTEPAKPAGPSRSERWLHAGLVVGMIATGALAWSLQWRSALEVDASSLALIPGRIGPYRAEDIPLDDAVESILRADFNLQRAYFGPDGVPVWLYVGYYGTARGGRPEHTPRGCYTGAGWGIEEARIVDLGGESALRANEYVVERGGQRRLVVFWYRSFRSTGMVGGIDASLDRIVGRLVEGRADGALVRVSTPIEDGDLPTARARLAQLGVSVDRMLADLWPEERPAEG
jgi:EpsI family protein